MTRSEFKPIRALQSNNETKKHKKYAQHKTINPPYRQSHNFLHYQKTLYNPEYTISPGGVIG
jgi:hypothetical protein